MSGIIKKIAILLVLTASLGGCKHYAPFPELDDDGVLKADSENVVYDNKAPIIGADEANQKQTGAVIAKVQPGVEKKEDKVAQVPEKDVVKKVQESKKEEAKVSMVKNERKLSEKNEENKDLSVPNPKVFDVAERESSFVVPSKTTPSVITDMDLTEMDAADEKPVTKIIKPVVETRTIVPVKKEIKEIMPKKQVSGEPSVFYLAETIYFNNGGSSVDSQYNRALRNVVKEAKAHNGKIVVQGFASSRTRNTDMMTHKMANLKISVARAESVAKLLENYGMPKTKIITEGLSDSRPVYLEVMPEGERLNRRAEVYISY